MKDPFLLEMTASEPLSLEEEYQMQIKWLSDPNKCIFIILVKDKCTGLIHLGQNQREDFITTNVQAMIGDVNLFINPIEDEPDCVEAELDVMIAERDARRKGYATEAVLLALLYGVDELDISRFFVKIHEDNVDSLMFFRERLGFMHSNYVPCFGEFELELKEKSKIALRALIQDIVKRCLDLSKHEE